VVAKVEDKRVHLVKFPENRGYSVCKNEGIIRSKGSLVCILDADDMLAPGSISSRVAMIQQTESLFLQANAIAVYDHISLDTCYGIKISKLPLFTEKLHLKKKSSLLRFPSPYHVHSQTVMVRREVYRTYGLYDESLRSRSDREMWWRFFGKSDGDKVHIPHCFLDQAVVYYRYHDRSMTSKRIRNRKYDREVREKAEQAYEVRKKGITRENTRFEEL
jgi:glycosyltransferase involved in cell wall biosynthesis